MGVTEMVERLMMLAGAELAQQSYKIMEARIRRLKQMKQNYGAEKVTEIDQDLEESLERLASLRHVLDIHGIEV